MRARYSFSISIGYLLLFGFLLFNNRIALSQDSLFQEAEFKYVEASYEQAYDKYLSAALLYDSLRDYEMYAFCNIQMAFCLSRMAAYQQSFDLSNNTLDYILEFLVDNQFLKAEAMRAKSDALLNIGKNDEALDVLLEAEKLYPEETAIELAEAYNLLGVIYWNNANQDLAIQYHDKALETRQSELGENSLQVGDSYNNIGLVYATDDPLQAGLYFERALKIYRVSLGNKHPKVAFCLINLARAYGQQGRIPEAIELMTEVDLIWEEIYSTSHPNKTFSISTLGQIYASDGNYERALHYQELALKEYINMFGQKHPEVANTYFLIAELHLELGNYKDAVYAYQQSIYANLQEQEFSSFRDSPSLIKYFHADYLLSALLGKAKALEVLHVEQTLKPNDLRAALDTYILADSLTNEIRKVRFTENDKIRLNDISRSIYDNGIRISLILGDQPFQKQRFAERALAFCERSKSSVLLEAIQETKAKSFAGIPDDLISLEDSIKEQIAFYQQQVSKGENLEVNQAGLFTYQQQHRDLVNKLENEYPRYYELKYQPSVFDGATLMDALDPYQAVISYYIGNEQIYIFLVTKDQISVIEKEKDAFFQQNLSGLRNAIKFRIENTLNFESKSLYRLLVPQIPENISELIIIPDGILNTIPFEVLRNPETDNYLVEDYAISYDYSATLLLQRREFSDGIASGKEILLIAPVNFEKQTTKLFDLPASRDEVRDIDFLFSTNSWNVESRTMDEATETMVKERPLSDYRYLHFATHGLVNESRPELSQLFLYPDSVNDGNIYSGDIYNLKVQAELVCLSACETGLGRIEKGEGIVGLSRALLYAGAQNLLVSLWQVADQSTSQLMIEFYRQHLFFDHLSDFNLALREAKKTLIRSENYNEPYFWAPFILVGQ